MGRAQFSILTDAQKTAAVDVDPNGVDRLQVTSAAFESGPQNRFGYVFVEH